MEDTWHRGLEPQSSLPLFLSSSLPLFLSSSLPLFLSPPSTSISCLRSCRCLCTSFTPIKRLSDNIDNAIPYNLPLPLNDAFANGRKTLLHHLLTLPRLPSSDIAKSPGTRHFGTNILSKSLSPNPLTFLPSWLYQGFPTTSTMPSLTIYHFHSTMPSQTAEKHFSTTSSLRPDSHQTASRRVPAHGISSRKLVKWSSAARGKNPLASRRSRG
ncbi:hypothetical protein EJ06DRAFT_258476 [Trichodelitschia bisporula]|uniref:Uncharacterized protein n=1 Tax=Trichodelitschia bisporula TaxID=703511 RepID=A0A6G1HJ97_9PEZI|nr:hypothetical protein EJ06DRAFT_258476 [Trichodelitschia bisporula]